MKKKIRLLAAPADREKLAPILEALGQKGASVTHSSVWPRPCAIAGWMYAIATASCWRAIWTSL